MDGAGITHTARQMSFFAAHGDVELCSWYNIAVNEGNVSHMHHRRLPVANQEHIYIVSFYVICAVKNTH